MVADTLARARRQAAARPRRLPKTLDDYDAALLTGQFDPTVRDGLATKGLELPKSNWAQRLDTPPYVAYPVTGGITFTFGGVKINERAAVCEHALGAHPRPLRLRRDGGRPLPQRTIPAGPA